MRTFSQKSLLLKLISLIIGLMVVAEISSCWDFCSMRLFRKGVCRVDNTATKTSFHVYGSRSWHCSQARRIDMNRPFKEWQRGKATDDDEALCAAYGMSMKPVAPGTPRIAFLFMTRGEMPLEPLWRRFLAGQEDKYSIYVHPSDPKHRYPQSSLFHERQIPSDSVHRFGINGPEAVRRLMAYALLDSTVPNAWFTVLCETAIPLRPFSYVYDYLMSSELSFVEAFVTRDWWKRNWIDKHEHGGLSSDKIRKGEPWVSVHRRHAGLLVGDFSIFQTFKRWWEPYGIAVEIYMPTMFTARDPLGIANRTLTHVDWTYTEHGIHPGAHPVTYNETTLTATLLQQIQNQTSNTMGFYAESVTPGFENQLSCAHNAVPNATHCFLFARKFAGQTPEFIKSLLDLAPVLGY